MRAYWSDGDTDLLGRVLDARKALPWCGPPPGVDAEPPPRAPLPGEVLLLTCAEPDARGSVWRTALTEEARPIPLIGSAEAAFRASASLAADHLPLVLPPPAADLSARVWPVYATRGHVVVDGASVGLSLALARAAIRLDAAVPASIAASAVVQPDGKLAPVDGLPHKLAAVYEGCPAVTRVIVAAAQLDQARALEGPWRDDPQLQIVGAATLDEAFQLAWGDVALLCRARLRAAPGQAADHLWDRIVQRHRSPWRRLAATAAHLSASGVDARRMDIVDKIARRHDGDSDVLLPWIPRDEAPHREPWLDLVAQVVQSAIDAGVDEALREYLRLAERELRPLGERSAAEIRLVGACGRGWAALHEAGRAEAHLREATEAWSLIGQPTEASIPLCEWLRVTSSFRLPNAADVVARAARAIDEVPFSEVSRAYLNLELARARLLAGLDPREAARCAEAAVQQVQGPKSPGPSARRWLIRALRADGQLQAAAEQRAALDALRAGALLNKQDHDRTLEAAPLLATLDHIEQTGGDLEGTDALEALEALRHAWSVEVAHAVRNVAGPGRAAAVIRHFRY